MLKRTNLLPLALFLVTPAFAATSVSTHTNSLKENPRAALRELMGDDDRTRSDRENDGLVGPVRRVKTETAKIMQRNGQPVEGQRVLIETASYDYKGAKIDNAYFLAAAGAALTGREVYKHDARGNITEMTLYNADGSILSREVYTYEFDAMGNWTKMTTSVAVVEGGKLSYEPTEVTYRTITYYLEENVVKTMQSPAVAAATPNNGGVVVTSANPNANPAASANKTVAAPAKSVALALPNPGKVDNAAVVVPVASKSPSMDLKSDEPVIKVDGKDAPERRSSNGSASNAQPNQTKSANSTAANSSSAATNNASADNAPAYKPPVRPVSGGVLNGKAISLPPPAYPEIARRGHVTGTVEVEVVIDASGKVLSAHAVSGPVALRQSAEQAAMQARFSPTMLSGQPVKVTGTINYKFAVQ